MSDKEFPELFDIAVIGAGPIGMTLALCLGQAGFHVALITPQSPMAVSPKDGRNFALMRGTWRILRDIGLSEALLEDSQPIKGFRAYNGRDQDLFGLFRQDIEIGQLDMDGKNNRNDDLAFGYMVPAERLHSVLAQAVQARIQDGKSITLFQSTFEQSKLGIAARDIVLGGVGKNLSARLICACDGINSVVRQSLDIGVDKRDYKMRVFNFDARLEKPHNGWAKQVFTPKGPCALLPKRGDTGNFAWYIPEEGADYIAGLKRVELEAEFNYLHQDWFGRVKITSGTPVSYPLRLQLAQSILAPRAVLLGTAARHVNPLVGQGMNIGFRDVTALMRSLLKARELGLDIGSKRALLPFKKARWGDGTAWALGIDSLDRVFRSNLPGMALTRGSAFTLMRAAPAMRRFFARQAATQD